jgi:DnaJ-domain-containing protein 1
MYTNTFSSRSFVELEWVPMSEQTLPIESDDADYYALLGVTETASAATIKAAFKHLALRYHPDVNHDADAQERMRRLLLAYRTLSNPAARQLYDARRSGSYHQRIEQYGGLSHTTSERHTPPGAAPRVSRDRQRAYAFPDLSAVAPIRVTLGEISYDLSSEEARTLQQQGLLRGIAREAIGLLPLEVRASLPHYCHRCHHSWIPAESDPQHARLWELICPACKGNDWGEYLLLHCVHCKAVFESEQIRDPLRPAGGKLYQPYELFPLCPFCRAARWCPAEDARLDAQRRKAGRRSG